MSATAAPGTAPIGEVVVEARGLGRRFGDQHVLRDVDLTIRRGEFVGLLGRSGSGKTTLLRALGGLDRGTEGHLDAASEPAVVFQDPRLIPWRSVRENVALGLRGEDPAGRAAAMLDEVGLDGRGDAWPRQLSGGQRQRASLARALVRSPDLLLLDEPFSALDALTRLSAQRLVEDLFARHSPAVLLVTHDVEEALLLSDRIMIIEDGRIALDEPVDVPRPRRRDDGRIVGRREALLTRLGVQDVGA